MTHPPAGLKLEKSAHIAQRAAALSARYASERSKAAWLELYADDAIIQDPMGSRRWIRPGSATAAARRWRGSGT